MDDIGKRQGIISIIGSIFNPGGGGGNTATSAAPSSSASSSPSTTSRPISTTQAPVTTSRSSADVTTTTATPTTTSISTRITSAPESSSSVSVVISSVTSDGQLVPITRTQTVVVVTPQATPGAQSGNQGKSSSNAGLIGGVVGGVVGGLALLALAIGLFIILKRRKERTGSAYFLCFGQRPKYGEKGDLDYSAGNWPSFDPSNTGNGGTEHSQHGRSLSRRVDRGLPPATLPVVLAEGEDLEAEAPDYSNQHTGYEAGSVDGMPDSPRSRERLGSWNDGYGSPPGTSVAASHPTNWSGGPMVYAPDYSHLDDPQTRREREEAAAAAAAAAAASGAYGELPQSGGLSSGYGVQSGRPNSGESTLMNTGVDDGSQGNKSSSSSPRATAVDAQQGAGDAHRPLQLANP